MSSLSPTPRPELIALQEKDVGEVACFIAVQSGREPAAVESHLRWFLLENPARIPNVPLGYGLRAPDARLVGCILCVPQAFRCEGRDLLLMGSSSFYVEEQFRGRGGLLFLKFSDLAREWPLFGNSANPDAAQLWKARGATPIAHSDHELFGVIRWAPILEEALYRRAGRGGPWSRMAKVASPIVASVAQLKLTRDESVFLVPLASAEEVLALVLPEPPMLTASRDLPYLRWRYFSGRDASVAAFAFRSKDVPAPVLVTVNQRRRGYRQQMNTLNLLDLYPAATPEVCASIVAALVSEYREAIDAIVLRGLDESRQRHFRGLGFKRRQFEAPNGWLLDRFHHLPACGSYFVPADGDWLT